MNEIRGACKFITKMGARHIYKTVVITDEGNNNLGLSFGYDEYLKDEVKIMAGARWQPESKCWTVTDCPRNWFQLRFLMGDNPYKWYDQTLIDFQPRNKIHPQQYLMAQHGLTYRQIIWAAEMGLGKTLAAIEVIEYAARVFNATRWWWVGPTSALASFDMEVRKWGMLCYPEKVMTYEQLVKIIKEWPAGTEAPHGVVFDEASRCKTPTAQRTQAGQSLADGMREDHGEDTAFVLELTGTPAPKSPLDWFSICEIAKPGFLREGNIHKFRERLSVTMKQENQITGGVYPKLLAWKDSDTKCKFCGCEQDGHDFLTMQTGTEPHSFVAGINEVARLYKRMKGLVTVYFKKDWLKELPEKQYRILQAKASRATTNAASSIVAGTPSAAKALILLRELSDGFQYNKISTGNVTCQLCKGSKQVEVVVVEERPANFNPLVETPVKMQWVECSNCGGTGEVPNEVRTVEKVHSPKVTLLESILDDHQDGRLVIYAGFTGSIDTVVEAVCRKGWNYIRVDGRGWHSDLPGFKLAVDMIEAFQSKQSDYPKLAFIGHPGSAGMGLTLTASCEIVYYSNDFNAESRIQSEDRIHRMGMDINKGAMITDILHLPSDMLILDNLRKKRRLQDMTLGQFHESLKLADEDRLL